MSVAIVDYGSGNLHSAAKAFERAARESGSDQPIIVTSDPDQVALTGKPRCLITWKDNSGNRHIGVGTHTNLFAINEAGTITDIGGVSGLRERCS